MNITCPDCDFPMAFVNVKGTVVDHCVKCGGIWFDPGEISKYVDGQSFDTDGSRLDDSAIPDQSGVHLQDCPRCGNHKLGLGLFKGLSFSRCSSCDGFFLNREQISAVVKEHTRGAGLMEGAGEGLPLLTGFNLVLEAIFGLLDGML
jgi:Zn-finger nucleic acid-binding protein